jgi:hypothetical protein
VCTRGLGHPYSRAGREARVGRDREVEAARGLRQGDARFPLSRGGSIGPCAGTGNRTPRPNRLGSAPLWPLDRRLTGACVAFAVRSCAGNSPRIPTLLSDCCRLVRPWDDRVCPRKSSMQHHRILSRDEWVPARRQRLSREREITPAARPVEPRAGPERRGHRHRSDRLGMPRRRVQGGPYDAGQRRA